MQWILNGKAEERSQVKVDFIAQAEAKYNQKRKETAEQKPKPKARKSEHKDVSPLWVNMMGPNMSALLTDKQKQGIKFSDFISIPFDFPNDLPYMAFDLLTHLAAHQF